jgi:hypothetical protein
MGARLCSPARLPADDTFVMTISRQVENTCANIIWYEYSPLYKVSRLLFVALVPPPLDNERGTEEAGYALYRIALYRACISSCGIILRSIATPIATLQKCHIRVLK